MLKFTYLNETSIQKIKLIEELDALKKRQKALSLGIVPATGTNWKAALKNKKLLEKAKNFQNSLIATDKGRNSSTTPFQEYQGTVDQKGNIRKITDIGTHFRVKTDDETREFEKGTASFHIHPIYTEKEFQKGVMDKIQQDPNWMNYSEEDIRKKINQARKQINDESLLNFRARPSAFEYMHLSNDKLPGSILGDIIAFRRNLNKSPFRYDYIGTPTMVSTPVSITRTTPKHQKTVFFANDASKYYDLNGRLKNKDLHDYDHVENVKYRVNLPHKANNVFSNYQYEKNKHLIEQWKKMGLFL